MNDLNDFWVCNCGYSNSIKATRCAKCNSEIPKYVLDKIYKETFQYYKSKYKSIIREKRNERQKIATVFLKKLSLGITFLALLNIMFIGYLDFYKKPETVFTNIEYNKTILVDNSFNGLKAVKYHINEKEYNAIQYKFNVICNHKAGFAIDSFKDTVSDIYPNEDKIYSMFNKIKGVLDYVKHYFK